MTSIPGKPGVRGSTPPTRVDNAGPVPAAPPAPAAEATVPPRRVAAGASGVDQGRVAGRHIALGTAPTGGAPAPSTVGGAADEVTSRRFVAATGGQVASAAPAQAGKTGHAFKDALSAGRVDDAANALKGMPRAEQLRALDGLDKAAFKKVVEGVRSGAISDDASVLAVNVAQLSRTSWGRTHDDRVDNLRERFVAGAVTASDNPDGKGTANVGAYTRADGGVVLNRNMARHPELSAAALANESVHALAAKKKDAHGSYLAEEAASTVADLRVWTELRKGVPAEALKGAAYTAQEQLHARHAPVEKLNEARVVAETAAHYAESLPSPAARARIIKDLSGDRKAQAALTPAQGEALARAAYRLATEGRTAPKTKEKLEENQQAMRDQVFALAIAMRHAPAATLNAAEKHLRALAGGDADALVGTFMESAKFARENQP